MRTSTKHSGSSSKLKDIGKRASKLYPDIEWVITKPEEQIEKDYGKGFILTGLKDNFDATYFILFEDPRLDNWIHMIASQLEASNG